MSDAMHVGLRPLTRLIIILIVLSPLALAVPALINEDRLEAPAPLPPRPASTRLQVAQVRPIAGFAINAHHIADLSLYLDAVDHIADLGANSLIVLTPMMLETVSDSGIHFDPEKCATDEQLVSIFRHARARGLHTTLLPIVLIEYPGEKDWRGVIRPGDWDAWWDNYDAFIDRFVNVANDAAVDLLIIGSELNSTEGQVDRWMRVAKRVRSGFDGEIGYSANWDRYDKVEFWPLVDVMCVSSYFELQRDDPDASESQLVEAWESEQSKLLAFAGQFNRPLVLSEVGYPSLPWASAHPWNYVAKRGVKADHEAQARCWGAFFDAWSNVFASDEGPAAGFFGYAWSPYYDGDAWDTGYGIDGKPAYDIVKHGIARIRNAAARDDN